MNLHQNWMSSTTKQDINSAKDSLIQEVRDRFDLQRYESLEGYSVQIDGIVEQVVIQGYTNPINADNKDRKMFCALDSVVHLGSVVLWDSRTFLVLAKPESNQAYINTKIKECNNTLKWYNPSNTLLQSPCIIETASNKREELKDSKLILSEFGRFIAQTPYNSITSQIKLGQRFIINGEAYKTAFIDSATHIVNGLGFLELILEVVQINNNDDLVNGIAANSSVVNGGNNGVSGSGSGTLW